MSRVSLTDHASGILRHTKEAAQSAIARAKVPETFSTPILAAKALKRTAYNDAQRATLRREELYEPSGMHRVLFFWHGTVWICVISNLLFWLPIIAWFICKALAYNNIDVELGDEVTRQLGSISTFVSFYSCFFASQVICDIATTCTTLAHTKLVCSATLDGGRFTARKCPFRARCTTCQCWCELMLETRMPVPCLSSGTCSLRTFWQSLVFLTSTTLIFTSVSRTACRTDPVLDSSIDANKIRHG
jgi:hypothetical protein